MKDYIDQELEPLAGALRARYPGVRIVWCRVRRNTDARAAFSVQQTIRFQAPLETLKRYGLVTEEIIRQDKAPWQSTELGDGFSLCEYGLDANSRPGCCDLIMYTEDVPRAPATPKGREHRSQSVADAARILKRIAASARL